jgi:hypothetical protein
MANSKWRRADEFPIRYAQFAIRLFAASSTLGPSHRSDNADFLTVPLPAQAAWLPIVNP